MQLITRGVAFSGIPSRSPKTRRVIHTSLVMPLLPETRIGGWVDERRGGRVCGEEVWLSSWFAVLSLASFGGGGGGGASIFHETLVISRLRGEGPPADPPLASILFIFAPRFHGAARAAALWLALADDR